MDRRVLVVPGAVLLTLSLVGVGVVHWEATLRAGAGDPTHPTVNGSDLPADCDRTVDALAEGRTVSVEGYRLWPDGSDGPDVVLRRSSVSGGWRLAETNCADRLAFVGDLRVDGRSYDVDGHYSDERSDYTPPFVLLRFAAALLGTGLFLVGSLHLLHRDAA